MPHAPFSYAAEKFSAARRSLMLPHPRGEAESVAAAFHECMIGLHDVRSEHLDESASDWVKTLERIMNTKGIEDRTGRGTWFIRAEQLSIDDKLALSKTVDELAYWFSRKARED